MRVRTALTVAGSDSGGGAGIQADLKTFLDRGVFGMSVVTAITAQNTTAVRAVSLVGPDMVREQLRAVFDDLPVDAMKTGMLADAATVDAVCDVLEALSHRPMLVVDPVMLAKDGSALYDPKALDALKSRLFPLATLVTPNIPEAKALGVLTVPTLLKGGHGSGPFVSDELRSGGKSRRWHHPRTDTKNTHGTGCTLSAAITAELAKGEALETACATSLNYVAALVRGATESLGSGHGPLLHGLRKG